MSLSNTVTSQRGLRQLAVSVRNSDGSYGSPVLVPAPQMRDHKEEITKTDLPGADRKVEVAIFRKGLHCSFKWGQYLPSLQALLTGATITPTGSTPNQTVLVRHKLEDIFPNIKVEGVVSYVGPNLPNGDYHFIGYFGTIVSPPSWANDQDKFADFSVEVDFLEDPVSGYWYDMVINETASALSATPDTTPPTLSSSSPANSATGVASGVHPTLTFSENIAFDPSQFSLLHMVSEAASNVSATFTYNSSTYVVTCTPGSALTTGNTYTLQGSGIRDIAGNIMADPVLVNFTIA